jgi:hypothetical protein
MTDLTPRELLDTILRSWMATRATFKSDARPPADEEDCIAERPKDERSTPEAVNPKS